MDKRFANKRSSMQAKLILILAVGVSLASCYSCDDIKRPKVVDITADNKGRVLNHDSLIKGVFKFAEPFYNTHSIGKIIALKGKPQRISKVEWGESEMHQDSLVTIEYASMKFNFLQSPNSYSGLQSFYLLDNKVTLTRNIKIGKTTRQEILQSLGCPDSDYNDVGRPITKDGSTAVYETQSSVGDTVTFSYNINTDEYALDFIMAKDTLRKIVWNKNMN